MYQLPDRALDVVARPAEHPERFSLAKTNETRLNIIAAAAYFKKNDLAQGTQLLETENRPSSTNDGLLTTAVHAYLRRGPFHQRAQYH